MKGLLCASADAEFSDICGTREECHKALDVLLDTCEANLRLGYEQRIIEAYKAKLADVKYKAEYEAKLQALKSEYGVE